MSIVLRIVLGYFWLISAGNLLRPPLFSDLKEFRMGVSQGEVTAEELTEASGMVASRKYPGYFWVHNDSGGEPRLFLLDSLGALKGEAFIDEARNKDWEDIAFGPCEEGECIYIGDIGDNLSRRKDLSIYYFPEPEVNIGDRFFRIDIKEWKDIEFSYSDGKRDAEALIVDDAGNLWIFSKREKNINLYFLKEEEKRIQGEKIFEKVGSLPYTLVTAADYLPGSHELLLKTYDNIYYWKLHDTDIRSVLDNKPQKLPYKPEPQGEAICFAVDGDGYYTVSEEARRVEAHLYFYSRIEN